MHKFSLVMDSRHYEDNFQPVLVEKSSIFHTKKNDWKFDYFWKTPLPSTYLTQGESSTLAELKYVYIIVFFFIFTPSIADQWHPIDSFPGRWETAGLCVPFYINTLFSVFFLIHSQCLRCCHDNNVRAYNNYYNNDVVVIPTM